MKKLKFCFWYTPAISVLLTLALMLFACAPAKVKIYPKEMGAEQTSPAKPSLQEAYTSAISGWKSYQDLMRWMEKDFSFDSERYKKFKGTLPAPRTPDETFRLKSGIHIDTAVFLRETLNRINSSYQAQVVVLIVRPYGFNHYVCSFKKDGKLFILDYGTPYEEITGVHGPYHSLDEYKRFYERHHPEKRQVEGIGYLPR